MKTKEKERRRHARFPVIHGLIEPINLRFAQDGKEKLDHSQKISQPAVLVDLSAGGISIISFMEPPHAKLIRMDLSLHGMAHIPVEGKIVRVHSKGKTHTVGIAFTKITKKNQKQLKDMALDYIDCETRIALNLPEACVPTCRFHCLCTKTQKVPYWNK